MQYLGILSTLLPGYGWILFGLGLLIAIPGAVIIQIFFTELSNNLPTLSIPTGIGVLYFFLVCPDMTLFFLATAIFLLVQLMYYVMWWVRFKA